MPHGRTIMQDNAMIGKVLENHPEAQRSGLTAAGAGSVGDLRPSVGILVSKQGAAIW